MNQVCLDATVEINPSSWIVTKLSLKRFDTAAFSELNSNPKPLVKLYKNLSRLIYVWVDQDNIIFMS